MFFVGITLLSFFSQPFPAKRYSVSLPNKCLKGHTEISERSWGQINSVVSVPCIYHYSTKIWNTYNNENYKQKAMDATPLNTSIIILCSVAGCTFGSENCAIFSNVEMSSLRGRKNGWLGWNWNRMFSNNQQKIPIRAAFQHKKFSWYHRNSLVGWRKENCFKVRIQACQIMLQVSVKAQRLKSE